MKNLIIPQYKLHGSRNFIFKILYFLRLHLIFLQYLKKTKRITILCFHRVSDDIDYSYPPLKIKDFKKIMKFIHERFTVISLNEIHQPPLSAKPLLVLTFDDGYKDFIENILPVLIKYNMPAVISVVGYCIETGKSFWTQRLNDVLNFIYDHFENFKFDLFNISIDYHGKKKQSLENFSLKIFKELINVDKFLRNQFIDQLEIAAGNQHFSRNKMMNENDLVLCNKNNIRIASHTLTHDSLITIQREDILWNEIFNSKILLEEKTNQKVSVFTFPNGLYNDHILLVCDKAGYDFFLTTEEHYYKKFNLNSINKKLIPRISLDKNSFEENIFKLFNFHNFIRWNG